MDDIPTQYPLNKDGQKYVLSLDSIDLNLLETYKFQRGNEIPTWISKNHEDLHPFEVFVHCDDSKDEEYETYTCQICCVEVPVVFAHDHECSDTHVAATHIAAAALKRMQLQLLQPVQTKTSKLKSNVYYCNTCSKPIKNCKKADHEVSNEHRKLKDKKNKLIQLCNIYTAPNELRNAKVNYINIDDTTNDSKTEKNDAKDKIAITNSQELNMDVKDNRKYENDKKQKLNGENKTTSLVTNTQNGIDSCKRKVVSECSNIQEMTSLGSLNVETVFKDTNETVGRNNILKEKVYKHDTLYVINPVEDSNGEIVHFAEHQSLEIGGKITLKALSGAKVFIPVEYYHGKVSIGDEIQCRVCRRCVTAEIYHFEYGEHIERVNVPIKDEHFIRELDEGLHHCVLCNIVVAEVGFHILLSPSHEYNLKKVVFPIEDSGKVKTGTTQKEKQDESKLIHYQFKRNKKTNEISCRICNIVVPKEEIDIHIEKPEHIMKYKALLVSNHVIQDSDRRDQFYCEACCGVVWKKYEVFHCGGKKHKKNLIDYINKFSREGYNDGKTNTNKLDKIEARPSGSHEIPSRYMNDLAEDDWSDSSFSTEESDTNKNVLNEDNSVTQGFFCYICKIIVDDDPPSIATHRSGTTHKKALEEFISFLAKYHIDSRKRCRVCDVDVTNPEKHVKETDHKGKYEKMIAQHNLVKTTINSFLCKICDIPVDRGNELDHILGDVVHTLKYNILCDSDEREKATKSVKIEVQPNSIHTIICPVCNVKLLNKQRIIEEHAKGKQHKNNLKKRKDDQVKQSENNLSKTETRVNNMYICLVCNVKLTNNSKNIEEHENGSSHKEKVQESAKCVDNVYICRICNVVVPNHLHNIKEHENGNRHKENFILESKSAQDNDLSNNKNNLNSLQAEVAKNKNDSNACTTGNIKVPNNEKNIEEHENGNKENLILKSKSDQVTDLNNDKNNIINLETEVAKNENESKDGHLCTTCNIKVPNNEQNIEGHENDGQHQILLYVDNYISRTLKKATNDKEIQLYGETNIEIERTILKSDAVKVNNHLCTLCNMEVPNDEKNIREHENGCQHKILLCVDDYISRTLKKKTNDQEILDNCKTKLIDIEGKLIQQSQDDAQMCPICEVYVPSNKNLHKNDSEHEMLSCVEKCIFRHMNKMTNNQNTENDLLYSEVKLPTQKDDVYVCYICNVDFPRTEENIEEHKNNWQHNLLSSILVYMFSTLKKDVYVCRICNTEIPSNKKAFKEHVNSFEHKILLYVDNYIRTTLKNITHDQKTQSSNSDEHKSGMDKVMHSNDSEHKSVIHSNDSTVYVCLLCNVQVPNNKQNIEEHENGSQHKILSYVNSRLHMITNIEKVQKNDVKKDVSNIISNDAKEVTQSKDTNNIIHLCTVCNVEVPNNRKNIEEHENGSQHKILSSNAKKKSEMEQNATLTKGEHNLHEVKTDKLPEVAKSDAFNDVFHICEICNTKVPNYEQNIEEHENGNRHRQNLNRVKNKANLIKKNDAQLHKVDNEQDLLACDAFKTMEYVAKQPAMRKCKVCDRLLHVNNVESHLAGFAHREEIKSFIHICNTLKNNDGKIKCHCNRLFDTVGLFMHITDKHGPIRLGYQ